MSRFAIRHRTTYRYSAPVSFGPHLLRLTPRADTVRLLDRQLLVLPGPLTIVEELDPLGNACTRLTFGTELTTALEIESRLLVETQAPADLRYAPPLPHLPWPTVAPDADSLSVFRIADLSREVSTLAHMLCRDVGGAPLAFFDRACAHLHGSIERGLRLDGAAQTPAETLAAGRGACRDLTVLYLALCRSLGVAGRFVSGYQGDEATPDGRRHLHAWPEVWVPQLGWLGWDPTHGVRTGASHVALCVAPEQAGTMPIEGGYYFNGASITSTLDYAISLDPASGAAALS